MTFYAPTDSAAVRALKDKREALRSDGSDWAANWRKNLSARIRGQRLKEARELGKHTPEQWAEIVARFDRRCVQCGCFPDGGPCKDHIKPIYQGGSDAPSNLQPLCRECNTGKGPDNFNWAAYREQHGFADVDASREHEAT